jgi:DNA polymerase-3 subunit epsilon
VAARLRTDPPPPRIDTTLGQLADRVGVPAGVDAADEAALAYLSLLDRVVEDRVVTESEIAALAETARSWGVGATAATALHRSYMAAMWNLARADGIVTANELHDLRLLSELLGVPADGAIVDAPAPVMPRADSLAGLSVCFTGGSVCTIGGAKLSRDDQEQLAACRGLVIKPGVSKHLDVLVLADPDSRSGKAQRAAELGVRRMAEPAFWRAIGVQID